MHLQFKRRPKAMVCSRHTVRHKKEEGIILVSSSPCPSMIATHLDVWANEKSIKLSYLLETYRATKDYSIRHGEGCARLEIKYHFDTRRSYVVYTPLRKYIQDADELNKIQNQIDKAIQSKYFFNITQPIKTRDSRLDPYQLFYPDELYDIFSEYVGHRVQGNWCDLAWEARLSYLDSIQKRKEIHAWFDYLQTHVKYKERKILKSQIQRYIDEIQENPFYEPTESDGSTWVTRKIDIPPMNFLKKKIRKGEDLTKEEQSYLMREACALSSVSADTIQKRFFANYWKNPAALAHHDNLSRYFTDINIFRNVLENVSPDSICHIHLERDAIMAVWHDESIVARRYVEDPSIFEDVTRMIYFIRQNGHEFKTKGPLKQLHELAIRDYSRVRNPDLPIDPLHEDEIIRKNGEEYLIHFPTTTYELIDVGNALSNCVASYGRRAARGELTIFTVLKEGKFKACCEVRNGALVQAYGFGNSILPASLERMIREYHRRMDWPTVIKALPVIKGMNQYEELGW